MSLLEKALQRVPAFLAQGQVGPDPLGEIFQERRKQTSLFTPLLSEREIEAFRSYIFCYDQLPTSSHDRAVEVRNFIAGEWRSAAKTARMASPGDRRVFLAEIPDSQQSEVDLAVTYAHEHWKSLAWAEETLLYRKHVVKNVSRILNYFYEDCLKEIRVQVPKTRLEADKDFWEFKRAADHLEGSAERMMMGGQFPHLVEGHSYWKNEYIPGGVAAIFAPMNFIYGIPGIHLAACYLTGSPLIFKGHPLAAITNTTLTRMFMLAGADPHSFQKLEGFGRGLEGLVSDKRVSVVSVTGSDATAERMQSLRGVRPVRFEGGGSNWAFVDDGFSDQDLQKIAVRLTYSKLGFSSHKCTTLHGVAGDQKTLGKLMQLIHREMDEWKLENPTTSDGVKVVGPCMVHRAQTAQDIQEAAAKAGAVILRKGGRASGTEYSDHAEVIKPIILTAVKPGMEVTVDWDGRGPKTFDLTTTEFFMPILVGMEVKNFDEFLQFCLFHNHHDLAVSVWSRQEKTLLKGRKVLAGMLKENDGTDSALEWEEFGASGMGVSGNMGVGDPPATFSIYCRRQKGRHVAF